MAELLDRIDALIDEADILPRKCLLKGRSRCQCGHHDGVHEKETPTSRGTGKCYGGRRDKPCPCPKWTPYDNYKEVKAMRDKLRKFAFEVRRLDG